MEASMQTATIPTHCQTNDEVESKRARLVMHTTAEGYNSKTRYGTLYETLNIFPMLDDDGKDQPLTEPIEVTRKWGVTVLPGGEARLQYIALQVTLPDESMVELTARRRHSFISEWLVTVCDPEHRGRRGGYPQARMQSYLEEQIGKALAQPLPTAATEAA
jgi:hypothetical protein